MSANLRLHEGGHGEPVLLLLHGLGATGDVWSGWGPVLAQRWPGRWIAPDLPGHGGSVPLPQYSFRTLAARMAECVPHGSDVVVLGHSLGGVVGLTLAGLDFGLPVSRVIGLGIKVAWSDEELRRAQSVVDRPTTWFDTRDEAAQRYLRISGLVGLVAADDPMVDAGVRLDGDRWRLALDVRAFGVGAPDMTNLLADANADVLLARGEHDAMNTDDELAAWGTRSVMLAGLGHNAHVENPDAVAALIG